MKKPTAVPENWRASHFLREKPTSRPQQICASLELSAAKLEAVRETFATHCVEAEGMERIQRCDGSKFPQSWVCNTRAKDDNQASV